jgi:hypothetical protein
MRRPPYTHQSPYLTIAVERRPEAFSNDRRLQVPLATPLLLSSSMLLEVVHGSKEQLRVAGGPFEGIMVACQDKERCWSMLWGSKSGTSRGYVL